MSKWFSGDVVANGIKIHYYRTDGDKPLARRQGRAHQRRRTQYPV